MSRVSNDPASPGRLEEAALRLLKVRERSRKELEDRLLKRGHPKGEVSRLLDRFAANGWVDDERFARLFVQERLRLRPKAYRLLDHELAARGVSAGVRDRVLGEARDTLSDQAMADSLAQKMKYRYADNAEGLLRWLLARGFTRSVAKSSVAAALGDVGDDAGDASCIDVNDNRWRDV